MDYGTILLEGSCDIKDTIELVYLDMNKVGIIPQWKNVQEKVSDACLAIYGVPPEFCVLGIKSQLMHGMTKDEKMMCDKGLQDLQYAGEKMPDINVFFEHQRDGKSHLMRIKKWH